jgi:hypothetical protein
VSRGPRRQSSGITILPLQYTYTYVTVICVGVAVGAFEATIQKMAIRRCGRRNAERDAIYMEVCDQLHTKQQTEVA